MTTAIAPRRFSRLEVQAILQEVGVSEWQTWAVMELMGATGAPTGSIGASVHRALGLLHAQNRPSFASPGTYGGMAWDEAYNETGPRCHNRPDLAGIWVELDEALARGHAMAAANNMNGARAYLHFVYLAQALVEREYGARPAPPAPPPAPAELPPQPSVILLEPEQHFEAVSEEDHPKLFEKSLITMARVWVMLPAGAKRFAARQLAAWLRSVGVGEAAADQVETFDPMAR